MSRAAGWLWSNLPGVAAFGFAMWAFAVDDNRLAQFYLLLMVLFGISRQIEDLRDRISTEAGRCGSPSVQIFPSVPVSHCDLPAGHKGWHRCSQPGAAAVEWSR